MSKLSTVVVERRFEQSTTFEALDEQESAVAWCLEQHGVTFVRTYLSLDGRTMICVYSAPDAEAVRETQRRGGLPVARLWSATILSATGRHSAAAGFSTVVVERDLPPAMDRAQLESLLANAGGCLETNRAELLESKLSLDRTRMLCVFQAPDAESVRRANRQLGVPVSAVWTATVHGP